MTGWGLGDASSVAFGIASSDMRIALLGFGHVGRALARAALPLARVGSVRGVLNSTTNHVLSAAARGVAFADALAEAQRLGIAEADPRNDLEGWDAAAKASILANALMDVDLRPLDV